MGIVVNTGNVNRQFAENHITQGFELNRDDFAKVGERCAAEYLLTASETNLRQVYQDVIVELNNWAKASSEESECYAVA